MPPRLSRHRVCWPMEEVRPGEGVQAGGQAVMAEERAACKVAVQPVAQQLESVRHSGLHPTANVCSHPPVSDSWLCLNTLERAKPRPSSSTERVSTPTCRGGVQGWGE